MTKNPSSLLLTQPNEHRCNTTAEAHTLTIGRCCPATGNPQMGSTVTIAYTPAGQLLEVVALRAYIDSFIGGRGDVRSMEGMIQTIAKDCAEAVGVPVTASADLYLHPSQRMKLVCVHG